MNLQEFSVCLMLLMQIASSYSQNVPESEKILSRKRRYLIFPTGSSFSVATCMTIGLYGNPQFSYISWALNYGFAYPLPTNISDFRNKPSMTEVILKDMVMLTGDPTDAPVPLEIVTPASVAPVVPPVAPAPAMRRQYNYQIETRPMIQRRYRRDLYGKMEAVMRELGYDGRECILRALCESSQFFGNKGKNMITEIIRTAFSFPKSKVMPSEHKELLIYDDAHRKGKKQLPCAPSFPKCGFSLLQMALGKYSQPSSKFM